MKAAVANAGAASGRAERKRRRRKLAEAGVRFRRSHGAAPPPRRTRLEEALGAGGWRRRNAAASRHSASAPTRLKAIAERRPRPPPNCSPSRESDQGGGELRRRSTGSSRPHDFLTCFRTVYPPHPFFAMRPALHQGDPIHETREGDVPFPPASEVLPSPLAPMLRVGRRSCTPQYLLTPKTLRRRILGARRLAPPRFLRVLRSVEPTATLDSPAPPPP